jgi:uncharacterized membrane protein
LRYHYALPGQQASQFPDGAGVVNRCIGVAAMSQQVRSTRRQQSRIWLTASLLCLTALAARAQGSVVEREVKATPGHDARVGVYTDIKQDCTSGPLPAIRLVTPPAHGAVNVKRGTLKATNFKQCLATEVPAYVALYHGAAEFNGTDEFLLEITWPGGRKELQHFRVNVSAHPGAGQGI